MKKRKLNNRDIVKKIEKDLKIGDTIKLDFDVKDKKALLSNFKERVKVLWFFKIKILNVQVFSTNHGFHVYLISNKHLNNADLVFLQLALGSDFMREIFYWKRIKYPVLKNKGWNILFSKKYYGLNSKEGKKGIVSEEKLDKSLSNSIFKILNPSLALSLRLNSKLKASKEINKSTKGR